MIRTPVGIGLMGCGRIAESVHVPIVTRLATARLVAAADTSAERRAWLGRHVPDVQLHATWESLLQDSNVEAVIVALPTCFHAEASCAAFTAGKHVYCEKPIAADFRIVPAVVRSWRGAGRLGMVGRLAHDLVALVVDADDRRHVERRRQIVDHGVEQRLYALVLERRTAQYRIERARDHGLADQALELALVRQLAIEPGRP